MCITQNKIFDFFRIIKIVFKISALFLKYTKYIQNSKLPRCFTWKVIPKTPSWQIRSWTSLNGYTICNWTLSKSTKWVSALVAVKQPNGKLRVYFNSKDINKAIKSQHFKLFISEIILQNICLKYLLNNGFWQNKIDKESSRLLTFATSLAPFCFKWHPYGIHNSIEILQADISKIIESLEGN